MPIRRDANGRASSIVDHESNTKVTYSYDSSGNLTEVTHLDSISGNSTMRYEWQDGVIVKYQDSKGTPIYLNYKEDQMVSIGAVE